MGRLEQAFGTWKLSDTQIVLTHTNASGVMRSLLTSLDAMKLNGEWILVRVQDRASYRDSGLGFFRKEKRPDWDSEDGPE